MKVTCRYFADEKNWGEGSIYSLAIDGKRMLTAGTSEPEDANLSRDLSFVFGISNMLKIAYLAGKNGEEFILDDVEVEDREDF